MKRAISGLLFVVILTACIFIHPLCFFALFFIINIIGILEFAHMAQVISIRINRPMCIICGCLLFTAGFLPGGIPDFSDCYFHPWYLGIVPETHTCLSESGFRYLRIVLFYTSFHPVDLFSLYV